jgi:hypothetical protein
MAVQADILAEVKNTLNIAVSTYDTDLTADLGFAVKDLYPIVVKDVAPAAATLNSDNRSVDVPAGIDQVRRVEIDGVSTDFFVHADTIYFPEEVATTATVSVFGAARMAIADVPAELETVLIYWTVSKFYAALAGNKRKYNSYMGTQGAAADRDIKDSADYFKQLGDEYLDDRVAVRGM